MQHRRLAVLACTVLLLSACSDVVTGVASPLDPPPSSAGPAPDGTAPPPPAPGEERVPDDPSAPADTGDEGGPRQQGGDGDPAGSLRVEGLRFESDEGSATLVIDLSGSGVPEWTAGYATDPGSAPVDVAGDALLRVRLGTGADPDGSSSSQIFISPGPIAEARTVGVSEGYEEVLIGIRGGELPFRAWALTDPGRIVVDVRSAG